jgi:hypothetical protein
MYARINKIFQEVIGLWGVLSQYLTRITGYNFFVGFLEYRSGGESGV